MQDRYLYSAKFAMRQASITAIKRKSF